MTGLDLLFFRGRAWVRRQRRTCSARDSPLGVRKSSAARRRVREPRRSKQSDGDRLACGLVEARWLEKCCATPALRLRSSGLGPVRLRHAPMPAGGFLKKVDHGPYPCGIAQVGQ